jgi:undecaprenyl-diphosphatase
MSFSVTLLDITSEQALSYAIWLHLGTLLAAVIYFRREIYEIATYNDKDMFRWLLLASLATGVTALPLYIFIREAVSAAEASAILLMIGLLLIFSGVLQRSAKLSRGGMEINDRNAIVTGLLQGFSILPGVSRSGTTVSALLLQGFDAERSFYLSFLMSVPAVFAAEIVLGIDGGASFSSWSLLAVAVSFAVGYMTLESLIGLAKKASFWKFCLGFGILLVLVYLVQVL